MCCTFTGDDHKYAIYNAVKYDKKVHCKSSMSAPVEIDHLFFT